MLSAALVALALTGLFGSADARRQGQPPARPRLQLEVLNGCGARGAAARFTTFLRSKGFDVVETKNHRSSRVPATLVVDRAGNPGEARRVAAALGVGPEHVIAQPSGEHLVEISVIVGADHRTLRPSDGR